MKKTIMILMVAAVFMHGWACANEPRIKQLSPETLRYMAQVVVQKYQNERDSRIFIGDMTVGSLVTAPLLLYYALKSSIGGGWKTLYQAWLLSMIANIGRIIGTMTMMELIDSRQNWKIDKVLKARTAYYTLDRLSNEQKLLFIAAYKHNISLMKLLISYQPTFLERAGIWEALTELFFNQTPTAERVMQLKEMITKVDYPIIKEIRENKT